MWLTFNIYFKRFSLAFRLNYKELRDPLVRCGSCSKKGLEINLNYNFYINRSIARYTRYTRFDLYGRYKIRLTDKGNFRKLHSYYENISS